MQLTGTAVTGEGTLFQSSPAPKGRCNWSAPVVFVSPSKVSILTGPEGPMQPAAMSPAIGTWTFQSSPAPKGRCN